MNIPSSQVQTIQCTVCRTVHDLPLCPEPKLTGDEGRLTSAQKRGLEELFLRGIGEAGMPAEITAESLIHVLRAGLDASRAFAVELLEGRTERARIAKDVLSAHVYGRCVHAAAVESAIERAETHTRDAYVRRIRKGAGL